MIKNFRTRYGSLPFGYVGNWGRFYHEADKKEKEEIKKALKRLHQLAGLTWADIYEPQLRICDDREIYCSYGWGQSLEAEKMPANWVEISQVMNMADDIDMCHKILKERLRNFFEFNYRLLDFIEGLKLDDYDNFKRHLIGLKKIVNKY